MGVPHGGDVPEVSQDRENPGESTRHPELGASSDAWRIIAPRYRGVGKRENRAPAADDRKVIRSAGNLPRSKTPRWTATAWKRRRSAQKRCLKPGCSLR